MLQDHPEIVGPPNDSASDIDAHEEIIQEAPPVIDDGKTLLYPGVHLSFPFKTSDRLLDDIRSDMFFLNSEEHDILYSQLHNGVLRLPMLEYSRKKTTQPCSVGYLLDQVTLKTKYEYESKTCPELNKINVFMGVLVDQHIRPESLDDVINVPIYHLKITVKTRLHLERVKKHVGVTHYHLIDQLHPFDKQDIFMTTESEQLVDSATYVSSDTNRLLRIEIFKPEFTKEDLAIFSQEKVKERYASACEKFQDLDPTSVPTQVECLNTLFKIFKGPLNRRSSEDILKTISADNKFLNSQIDPSWLTEKYDFKLVETTDEETGELIREFEPPDLTDYVQDLSVRSKRESYTRKCLELIFLGKTSAQLLPKDILSKDSKSRSFNLYQTNFSTSFWFHLLGDGRNFQDHHLQQPFDNDYHFINLSASSYYSDKDIIKNYETQISLDPENVGIYFDALNYIANTKGGYQLIAYCGKQNIVGKEALDGALTVFGIDSKDTDVKSITDELLLSIYKNELKAASMQKRTDLKNALRLLAKFKESKKLKFHVDYEPYTSTPKAYQLLEIDESVDLDIIQTAYTIRVADAPGLKIDCDRALYTLAVAKRSLVLFNFLTQECPIFQEFYNIDNWSYKEALSLLQVNENATDDVILEIFQRKWSQEPVTSPDQFLILKTALTKLGIERNSKLINHFIDTGIVDVSCLPAGNWPTGLNNIGNTCYLNSLLQYYFSISPLRDYILNYQKTLNCFRDLEDATGGEISKRRIGSREVSKPEVERSVQFVYQLRDLFRDMVHTKERFVTPTKELAYLAFAPSNIEVEFEAPTITAAAPEDLDEGTNKLDVINLAADGIGNETEKSSKSSLLDVHNQQKPEEQTEDIIMGGTQEEEAVNASMRVAKISSDQLENTLELGRQQDVTECIGNVLFQLESASDPWSLEEDNEQHDLIKELFYGKIKQHLIPVKNPSKIRTKIERFVSLLVNIGDHPKDIYDALDLYFKDDLLQLDEDGEVKRTVAVTNLPKILQIQIQRVYYDRERFMPFKSIEPLPFSETIYMDRYMDTDDPVMLAKREDTKKLKEELRALKDRQHQLLSKNDTGLSFKGSLLQTKKFLQSEVLDKHEISVENKGDLVSHIDSMITKIDGELSSLYQKITALEVQIANQFNEFTKIGYSLFAAFIHRGEASYGHYWIYIKDRKKNGIWRKYNDESVTEVPQSEVFNFAEGNTATPYFLVYIKEGHEDEIEPLKRVIKE